MNAERHKRRGCLKGWHQQVGCEELSNALLPYTASSNNIITLKHGETKGPKSRLYKGQFADPNPPASTILCSLSSETPSPYKSED